MKQLRDKFFKECVENGKISFAPHDLFEWIKKNFKPDNKIYEFLYCDCIHEGSDATVSIHRTKEGAEEAMQKHKDKKKVEWQERYNYAKEEGEEKFMIEFGYMESWDVVETEIED